MSTAGKPFRPTRPACCGSFQADSGIPIRFKLKYRDENQELTLMAGGKIAEAGGRSDFTPCHQR